MRCNLCGSLKTKEMEEEEMTNILSDFSRDDQLMNQGGEVSETFPPVDFLDESGNQQGEEVSRALLPEEDLNDDDGEQGEEQDSQTLPEELVGNILSMVPFPNVFKARTLSKQWRARLSSTSREDDDEEKTIFQKQVIERSTTWKTFCPVFLGKDNLMTFDRSSCSWRKQSLSALPGNLLSRHKRAIVQMEGALILVSAWLVSVSLTELQEYAVYFYRTSTLRGKSGEHDLYVANLLTRTWKQLPPIPLPEDRFFDEKPSYLDAKLVSHTPSGTYKVVVFYAQLGYHLAQIFDSSAGSWNRKMFRLEAMEIVSYHAYLNGVFYRVVRNNGDRSWGLLAFNLEKCTFEVLHMLPVDVPIHFGLIDLVICNGSLIMIAYNNFYVVERVIVLKIDLGSRKAFEVTRGPPATLNFGNLQKHPASDGDCIFFASTNFGGTLAYNVREDNWSSFPCPKSVVQSHFSHVESTREYGWTSSSFQPGLNPFMAI